MRGTTDGTRPPGGEFFFRWDDDDDDGDAGDAWDGIEFEFEWMFIIGGVDDGCGGWTRGARGGVGDANEERGSTWKRSVAVFVVVVVVGGDGARD